MNTTLNKTMKDAGELKDDILRLLSVTAGAADERILTARKRLGASLGSATEVCGKGTESARRFVNAHAVESAIIACLAGLATGWLMTRLRE